MFRRMYNGNVSKCIEKYQHCNGRCLVRCQCIGPCIGCVEKEHDLENVFYDAPDHRSRCVEKSHSQVAFIAHSNGPDCRRARRSNAPRHRRATPPGATDPPTHPRRLARRRARAGRRPNAPTAVGAGPGARGRGAGWGWGLYGAGAGPVGRGRDSTPGPGRVRTCARGGWWWVVVGGGGGLGLNEVGAVDGADRDDVFARDLHHARLAQLRRRRPQVPLERVAHVHLGVLLGLAARTPPPIPHSHESGRRSHGHCGRGPARPYRICGRRTGDGGGVGGDVSARSKLPA
jgi:hypothetical protein